MVDMVLLAHLGHRELRLPVTDRLTLDPSDRIAARRATFDPAPAIHALLSAAASTIVSGSCMSAST